MLRRMARPIPTTLFALLLGAALALAGRGGTGNGSGVHAWFDASMNDGAHRAAPMEIVAHAADPGGVALVEISINDKDLSRRLPASQPAVPGGRSARTGAVRRMDGRRASPSAQPGRTTRTTVE
jgi:hypothetical protein